MKDGVERVFDLGTRVENFALAVIHLYTLLAPNDCVVQVIGKQLLRSGTSVGAHYFEAKRARSTAEFCSKIEGGLQELEETGYWLRLLDRAGKTNNNNLEFLHSESAELLAILTTCVKNAKRPKDV
jgi:four helix bundle protein